MIKKKNILFAQDSLALAGSEKSLVSLLKNINPDYYSIDLQLMFYGGPLEKELPSYVNLLKPLDYSNFSSKSILINFFSVLGSSKFNYFIARLKYSLGLRINANFNHPEKAQLFWEKVGKVLPNAPKQYDVAIGFAQGIPTFYIADKVKATKKISWVNTNMTIRGTNNDFQNLKYKKIDKIVCITETTKNYMEKSFPELVGKFVLVPNIIDYQAIVKASLKEVITFKTATFNILTVGRLNEKMKGVDITIEACLALRNKGLSFHWYILGEGSFRKNIEKFIKEHNLQNYVTLLGNSDNPYPYFKAADLYVQTSRQEGYCRTIAEARMLNIPIVTTRFDSVFQQMIHEKNGLVTDMNANAVADGIERIMKDQELYNLIVNYLTEEEKENYEAVKKFDILIEELLDFK